MLYAGKGSGYEVVCKMLEKVKKKPKSKKNIILQNKVAQEVDLYQDIFGIWLKIKSTKCLLKISIKTHQIPPPNLHKMFQI